MTDPLVRAIHKLTAPLKRRVMLMIGRCVLTVIDDSTKSQTVQAEVLEDDVRDDIERFQEYGFTSAPAPDVTEGIVVFVGGNRSHPVVIATENRDARPTGLVEGEVALYTIANGIRLLAKDGGEVHLGTDPAEFVALANLVFDEIDSLRTDVNTIAGNLDAHEHNYVGMGMGSSAQVTTGGPAAPDAGAVSSVAAAEVKAK